ncbi:hypothetical protein QR685DRAFT_440845, partial [Neurospora intermedia]
VATSTIEVEFTILIPTAKALDWVGSIFDNLDVNVGLHKINRILYTDNSNAKDWILNPNILTSNKYVNI